MAAEQSTVGQCLTTTYAFPSDMTLNYSGRSGLLASLQPISCTALTMMMHMPTTILIPPPRRPNILPLPHPLHQPTPTPTLMHSPKPRNTAQRLILDLSRKIRRAHERLPQQIDTMPHMLWRNLGRDGFGLQRLGGR